LSTTFASTIAGRMADGVLTAALAFDGVSVAAAIVTAAAARLRNNLRIYVPLRVMYRPRGAPYAVDPVALMSDPFS
jgi:hypothetical protein